MQAKIENNAGKKNSGGAAFNIINQDFDNNNNGAYLRDQMEDSKVRAMLRAQDLQKRGNA